MNKIKVAVDNSFNSEYKNFFNKFLNAEYIPLNDVKSNLTNEIKLVIFTGGEDVNPLYYNEEVGKYTSINVKRDENEMWLFKFFPRNIPKIGICRGAQFLTVASGGKLVQHVEGHCNGNHTIELKSSMGTGKDFMITSTHHQMMFPYGMNKKEYELIAWSKNYLSDVYLNGKNEQITLPFNFLEPEIVYYNNTNSLAIQGHPEYSHCPDSTQRICIELIKKYLDI